MKQLIAWGSLGCSLMWGAGAMAQGPNYPASGPFYSGKFASVPATPPGSSVTLKFVSYNVNFAKQLNDIIQDLTTIPELRDADFIQLQETVSNVGGAANTVEAIARALRMNYVFSPGCVLFGQDYGNAVLSRWPLSGFHKFLLPYSDADNQRVAVGAIAQVGSQKIRVYSIHLTVKFPDSFTTDGTRAKQVAAALDPIDQLTPMPTYISGDFNDVNPIGWHRVLSLFSQHHYTQVPDKGWTFKTRKVALDHAFVRGFQVVDNQIAYSAKGSDHVPIWSKLQLPLLRR